ncbi:hypothetical protein EBT31_03845 [bacterium]|nr:hypothetical protein [bacterium]NBX48755.1 hypothetical protein [bacterium]
MNTIEKDATPEKNREIRLEVHKSEIQLLNKEDIELFLTQLEEKELNYKQEPVTLRIAFQMYFHESELGPDGPRMIDIGRIAEQCGMKKRLLNELKFRARSIEIAHMPSMDFEGHEFTVMQRIERIIQMYSDTYELILYHTRIMERLNSPYSAPIPLDHDGSIYRYSSMETADSEKEKDLSPWQQLLLYLLHEAYLSKYKRYRDHCFREIKTADGKSTRAWEPVMEIAEFVFAKTQKECKYDMWRNLTSKGACAKDTINYLTTCMDIQFPDIKKNRHVWSFRNGIFIGKYWDEAEGIYKARFLDYESEAFDRLDPTIVSCKYFDQYFDDKEGDWYNIPTPHMQSVMDYQRFPEEVCRWLYVFCGRLCFDVGEMDSWQIMPFLKGIAGTGKSTLITKVCKKFYESDDVKTLSNNIEKKFGLESIKDGFVFIAPEIKGDIQLEQAEFQSLVSGEDISVARKFKTAQSVTWKVPGIFGGNEMPGWKDNSGSILRRILVWNFGRQVVDADPTLDQKLDAELPLILQKCVKAYVEYAQKYKSVDIWNAVPGYFKTIRQQVAMVTNVLQNFLNSEKLRFGPDLFCPQKLFIHSFNQHCQENNLGRHKFNPDFYAGPFSSKDLEVRTESMTYQGRAYIAQPFIFGVDVVQEANLEFSEDY